MSAMEANEVEVLVSTIVNARLRDFKQSLDLELAPFKLTVQGLEKQMVEVREANTATASGISRIEGKIEASEEMRSIQHQQNLAARAEDRTLWMEVLTKFNSHLGEHVGQEKHEEKTINGNERSKDNRRRWIQTIGALAGSLGAVKWLADKFHWHL